MSDEPLTLGTAGHIDHGKTALIRALTGTDTDRLPEERDRGISIALGYARLTLPSGRIMSVIDVPGHERFVRTMVAGATGIDMYLMTVAADDGVMPQTREHAAVLKALAVDTGVVAITKSDIADPERAAREAAALLPDATTVRVSARTGAGLDELRQALEDAARSLQSRAADDAPACLHIDRVFTIKGSGTVITGTLWSGSIAVGDRLRLLPGGTPARVKSVQIHDRTVDEARAGQRVAVNLTGVAVKNVARGDVLAASRASAPTQTSSHRSGGTCRGDLEPTYILDAALDIDAEHGDRVQVHHGTRESPARLAWLGGRFWQIRLEQPLIPAAGDRVVVRRIAPPDTLGGGVVLDPRARKHGPSRDALARLERLERGGAAETDPPASPGPPTQTEPRAVPIPPPLTASALAVEARLRDAGLEPPSDAELDLDDLAALRAAARIVRVSKSLHYHPDTLAKVRTRAIGLATRHGGAFTLAQFRDELGTSRKFAQALLDHLDSERITIRRGDEHHLRRSTSV